MKISVEDGIIVCSIEDKERKWRFMTEANWCFKGFYKNKLRIISLFGDDKPDRDFEDVKLEERLISRLLFLAEKYDVEINGEAYALLTDRRAVLSSIIEEERAAKLARERAIREEQERVKLWQEKCEKGCGKCPYRKRGYEDNYCAASGKLELLDEKNVPGYVNGIHYLFKYEPFPSENCVYKIN